MDDEWMSANDAYRRSVAVNGEKLASSALLDLVHAGLIGVRTETVNVVDEAGIARTENSLPAEFWQVGNRARVDQNWAIGTLQSFIPSPISDDPNAWMDGPAEREAWTAFGVQFCRSDIDARFPDRHSPSSPAQEAPAKRHKKPAISDSKLKEWWETMVECRDNLPQARLLMAVQQAYPNHFISRDRVRLLTGERKRGPKQLGGKETAK